AVRRGNYYVENHQVVGIHRGLIEGIVPGRGDIHGVGLFAQTLSHKARNPRIVFHKEQPHAFIIRQKEGNETRVSSVLLRPIPLALFIRPEERTSLLESVVGGNRQLDDPITPPDASRFPLAREAVSSQLDSWPWQLSFLATAPCPSALPFCFCSCARSLRF